MINFEKLDAIPLHVNLDKFRIFIIKYANNKAK